MPLLRHLARRLTPLLVAALALAALVPAGLAFAGNEPVTLRIGIVHTASETGTNPFLATEATDWLLMTDMYDLLIEFGPDLAPAPGLADFWEPSADGLTWTYHIREGMTWHDGQPITAEDVAFTFNFIRSSQDPAYVGPQAPDGNDLAGAEEEGQPPVPDGSADNPLSTFDNYLDLDHGFETTRITSIEATDAQTLVIKSTEPIVTLNQMYIPIVPKHFWETVTYAQMTELYKPVNPIGSGPFILKEFLPDQFIRLEAFEDYWGGAPQFDQLIYQYFDNQEASVAALRSNDQQNGIDVLLEVPPTLVDTVKADPNITLFTGTSSDFIELGFNSWNPDKKRFKEEGCADCTKGPTNGSLGNPWLTKPEVRAALAQLLDKQRLVDHALLGYGTPGHSVVGPYSPHYYYEPPADDPARYPGTPEAAQQRFLTVMTGLGFSDTDGDGVINVPNTPDAQAFDPQGAGKNWKLRLFIREDDREDQAAGDLIQDAMQAAGVKIDKELRKENPGFYDFTYPSSTNADMDMYIWGFGPDPDPDFILSIFACEQINNWQDANYCDPAYDQMYASSRTLTDLDQRAQIVKQLQAKVYTESPYAVLWYSGTLEAYRSDRWTGFKEHPSDNGDLWGAWGFGPYGSRLSVAPVGAVEPSPSPSPAPTEPPAPSEPVPSPVPSPVATPPAPSGSGAAASPGASSAATPVATATPGPGLSIGPSPTPRASAAPSGTVTSGGGDSTPLILAAAVVAALGAGGLLFMRRRAARDDE